jgi:hypothetical protein
MVLVTAFESDIGDRFLCGSYPVSRLFQFPPDLVGALGAFRLYLNDRQFERSRSILLIVGVAMLRPLVVG